MDNKTHVRNAARAINDFHETLSRIAGALKAKYEILQQQAAAPVAHEPEDLGPEFEELDAALESLGGVGTTLSTIGGTPTGTTAPLASGSVPSQTPARGTGPETNPGIPNAGAPGGGFTPTGSHDTGPGGSRPIGGVAGVPVTTVSGEAAPTPPSNIVPPNMGQPVDANITSPGQTGEGQPRDGVLVADESSPTGERSIGDAPPEVQSTQVPPPPEPEGVVPAGPLAPPEQPALIPAPVIPPTGGPEEGSIASQFTGEPFPANAPPTNTGEDETSL